jgi:two-component system, sensor histidine kinase LadS
MVQVYIKTNVRYYILSFILLVSFLHGSGQSIQLNEESVYTFQKDTWQYFKTSDRTLNIKNIIQIFKSGQFMPVGASVMNEGIASGYYWIHFSITNNGKKDRPMSIDIENPRINRLELFEMDSGEVRSLGKLGDYNVFNQRPIKYKDFVYETVVPSAGSKDYFLFIDQVGQTLALPIRIVDKDAFQSETYRTYLTGGLVYGILLFVSLLSLLFFINTQHPLYVYYGLYILSSILWFFSFFGLGYQYFWGNYPAISTISAPFAATLNLAINIQIAQIILQLKKVNPFLYKASNIFQVLLLAIGVLPVFLNLDKAGYQVDHAYLFVFLTIILGSIVILLYSIILYSIKGQLSAKFYFIASILKIGNIFNLALLELGISPGFYYLEKSLQVGILIETTFLTYAIANRYTNYKVKTFNRVLEAQEEERSTISKELHDGVSSPLTGLKFAFSNLMNARSQDTVDSRGQMQAIAQELEKLQSETRYLAHNLLPDYVKLYPLTDIVDKYIREADQRYQRQPGYQNIRLNFSSNTATTQLNTLVKLQIFRIIQELIANILKHSQASNADIIFTFTKKSLSIIAEDNGVGFPAADIQDGMGIKNIRSRVNLLNGSMSIQTNTNGKGAFILIKIPLNYQSYNLSSYDF